MNLEDLTRAMHRFVSDKGWYDPASPRPQTPRNLAISLSLEASEVLELFQWQDTPPQPGVLEEELADVALYLLQLASISGIGLEKAILAKLERNARRTWDKPQA